MKVRGGDAASESPPSHLLAGASYFWPARVPLRPEEIAACTRRWRRQLQLVSSTVTRLHSSSRHSLARPRAAARLFDTPRSPRKGKERQDGGERERKTHKLLVVHLGDGGLGGGLVGEGDEAEATGTSSSGLTAGCQGDEGRSASSRATMLTRPRSAKLTS